MSGFPISAVSLVVLPSDVLVWASVVAMVISFVFSMRRVFWQQAFMKIVSSGTAVWCFGLLVLLVSVALIDSIHFKMPDETDADRAHPKAGEVVSVLDKVCFPFLLQQEASYSAPMSNRAFVERVTRTSSGITKEKPPLKFGGQSYDGPPEEYKSYVTKRLFISLFWGALWGLLPAALTIFVTNYVRPKVGLKSGLNRKLEDRHLPILGQFVRHCCRGSASLPGFPCLRYG